MRERTAPPALWWYSPALFVLAALLVMLTVLQLFPVYGMFTNDQDPLLEGVAAAVLAGGAAILLTAAGLFTWLGCIAFYEWRTGKVWKP